MRNHWIQKTWKLEIREVKGELYDKIEFTYGPYKAACGVNLTDLKDQCNIDAGQELYTIIICEMMYQYGLQNSHQWFDFSCDDRSRVFLLIRTLRAGEPYKHLLDS